MCISTAKLVIQCLGPKQTNAKTIDGSPHPAARPGGIGRADVRYGILPAQFGYRHAIPG
jgi:hypothetical protein